MMPRLRCLILLLTLAACGTAGDRLGRVGDPTRFGVITACEPANWAHLGTEARLLPPPERAQVETLLFDAQQYWGGEDPGHCIAALQQAEQLLRQARARRS